MWKQMGVNIWTYSRIKTRMNCPMLEHLRYEKGLVPVRRRMALDIGTAVHKGIEKWDIDEALKMFDGIYPADQSEADELEIAKATVKGMLTAYFERFEPFENCTSEMEFEMPLMLTNGKKSRKYFLAGKMDAVAHEADGDWLVEYKTAGQLTGAYFDRLYVDEQITMYFYALKRLGFHPVGVIYQVIRKPTIRPKKGESLNQYTERLIADYRNRPDFYFFRQKLYRTAEDLEAFEQSLRERILAFERDKKAGRNYMNTGHCAVYSGCAYLPICTKQNGAEALFECKAAHEELNGGEVAWD